MEIIHQYTQLDSSTGPGKKLVRFIKNKKTFKVNKTSQLRAGIGVV
jgi:hypothetical protein